MAIGTPSLFRGVSVELYGDHPSREVRQNMSTDFPVLWIRTKVSLIYPQLQFLGDLPSCFFEIYGSSPSYQTGPEQENPTHICIPMI